MTIETGLRRLRYFKILSETLNYRAAAKRLNITQPALSRAIQQLEDDIGVLLLVRSRHRVILSAAGETFARGCNKVLQTLEATVEETARVAKGLSGTLVVGYTDTAIAGCLPDILQSLRQVAPDVVVKLVQAYTELQVTMLRQDELDVALMTGPADWPDTVSALVQSDRLMVLLPSGHPFATVPSLSLQDLSTQPFVLGDPDRWGIFNGHLLTFCERSGFRPEIVQTAPESRAIIGLVACGVGITVMPECHVAVADHRIVARPLAGLDERLETFACWKSARIPPAADHLLEIIRKRSVMESLTSGRELWPEMGDGV